MKIVINYIIVFVIKGYSLYSFSVVLVVVLDKRLSTKVFHIVLKMNTGRVSYTTKFPLMSLMKWSG